MARERILFVTGRLAEFSLRSVLDDLSGRAGFDYDVAVLGISVAALMRAAWVERKLTVEGEYDRVVLPGWCEGPLEGLSQRLGVPVERGPKDLYDLPEHFGQDARGPVDLSEYSIEIVAEINHVPRLDEGEVLTEARRLAGDGADVIDLGCVPGEVWPRAGEVTRMLVDAGLRVSIDSFERAEVEAAVAAGAELVLSCNGRNVAWAGDLEAELVVIPDDPHDLETIEPTMEALEKAGRPFRIDPVLEPIGFGFAASLERYFLARRRWPEVPMMMGVGNLTELTEVDSAGVNMLLAGLCEELGIGSVLTTEVINWARSSVRELDAARRLTRYSVKNRALPKHVDSSLVMLRDAKTHELGPEALAKLAGALKDANFRIFAEGGLLHLMNRDGHWRGRDPFELFDAVTADSDNHGRGIDPSHAFYLGYELAKAVTALTLSKQYAQDEALDWGLLTVPEQSALERRHRARSSQETQTADEDE